MAFGQPSGPPATARQVRELLELLQAAGHTDFRDARGPMGFTQRQAGGRFTRDEATDLIEQLQAAQADVAPAADPVEAAAPERLTSSERALRRMSDRELATELVRRGWTVSAP